MQGKAVWDKIQRKAGRERLKGMEKKRRMANYELLRILAMVMVVVMHFLSRSGSLPVLGEPLTSVRVTGALIEAFCLVAVNTYLLLSGYLGVNNSFKPSKAAALLCQLWFYALLIPFALALLGIPVKASELGIYGLVQYLFPIETEHYWFATSYFMLYLLTPVLNRAAQDMTQRQFGIVLAGLLILFGGIKSVSPVGFAFDRYGYDLPWFICVYLTGAYLRLYKKERAPKEGWLLYAGSCLLGFGVNLAMWFLAGRQDSFSYYFTVPYHYNFLPCLAGAVGLLYGFSGLSLKEGALAETVRRLGSLSFGVYLFHEHIDLRERWYGWLKAAGNPWGGEGLLFFLRELFFCTAILFVAGVFIDWIRSRLFKMVKTRLGGTGISERLKRLDECFQPAENKTGV